MSPAEGIYNILAAANFFTGGWTPYVGLMGESANCIACLNTGGASGEVMVAIDYPTVQLLGRGAKSGNSFDILYEKMKAAKLLLHGITETSGADAYPELVSCIVRGDIAQLGQDENQRPLMSLNFQLITAPADVGNRTVY